MNYSGQQFECNFRFKEEIEERKIFLEHRQNIFIFSAYTAAKKIGTLIGTC